jgi:hypothetical protein
VDKISSLPWIGSPERFFTQVGCGLYIRLSWNGLTETNTLAYYKNL